MEYVKFSDIRSRILNDIKRHSLLPIVGSGFSRGCETANGGQVPCGEDFKNIMIDEISKSSMFTEAEIQNLKKASFSDISEIYHSDDIVSNNVRRKFLRENFKDVIIRDSEKMDFINLEWDYIYTLNIDDAIERNSRFSQVVYANRDIHEDIFSEESCVIKIHGDVSDMLAYKDSRCEIFDTKQYAISPETNIILLQKFRHDLEYQNIVYIGCSLDDERDLVFSCNYSSVSATNRYFCYVGELSKLKEIKLRKYGITHCVKFDNYESIYRELVQLFKESKEVQNDEIENFMHYRYTTINYGYEENSKYLFQGKSLIGATQEISFPHFFIKRHITRELKEELDKYVLVLLCGAGCVGKTYVCIELASIIRNRNVYVFESKTGLSFQAFAALLQKKESLLLFDEHVLSNSQIDLLLKSMKLLRANSSNVILVARNNNRDLPGLIRYASTHGYVVEKDIKRINMPNNFSDEEVKELNSLLVVSDLGVFYEGQGIADNIITIAKERSEKNKFSKIVPRTENIREVVSLILLAIKRKVYSRDAVLFDIEQEIQDQCKRCNPLIDEDCTQRYEVSGENNSPIKYVLNAEYWLCDFLSTIISSNKRIVVDSFKHIVRHIIVYYGKPDISYSDKDAQYKDYILFDNIVAVFKKQANMYLIKDIYESLNEELASDPNYLHQRAKCYIRLSDVASEMEEKIEYLSRAFLDASTAYSVFNKRYIDSQNDKVFISASHALYTKALCKCHLSNYGDYVDVSNNSEACFLLCEALQSPYNIYRKPYEDRYNYGDVVMKFLSRVMMDTTLIDDDAKNILPELYKLSRKNELLIGI